MLLAIWFAKPAALWPTMLLYGVIPVVLLVTFVLTLHFNGQEEQARWKRIEACCRSKAALRKYKDTHFHHIVQDLISSDNSQKIGSRLT